MDPGWQEAEKNAPGAALRLCSTTHYWLPRADLHRFNPNLCPDCSSQLFIPTGFPYAASPEALD